MSNIQYEISLEFSNNLLQTFLIEVFEKAGIKLPPTVIFQEELLKSNLIKITYYHDEFYLLFQTKQDFTDNVSKSPALVEKILHLKKLTPPQNIIVIFYQISFDNYEEEKKKSKALFFLTTELKVKALSISNNNELIDYIYNFLDSITKKESKSKIHFFDAKPVQTTGLCDVEGIKNKVWVKHLMCISGISERKAIAIVKSFPDMKSLYDVYLNEEFDEVERSNILSDVEIENKLKSQNQKIGKALSNKIYKYYMSMDEKLII